MGASGEQKGRWELKLVQEEELDEDFRKRKKERVERESQSISEVSN